MMNAILDSQDETTEQILTKVVQKVAEVLKADRCFIDVRDPSQERSLMAFEWGHSNSEINDFPLMKWIDEKSFSKADPLYHAALACQPSIYVDDIETASPSILDREFEKRFCGHRALIHAHIVKDGQLWGILEPCVFDHSRQWTEDERQFIESLLPPLADHVIKFVNKLLRDEASQA